MSGATDRLLRTVVWRNLSASGSEYCSLCETAGGWRLEGTVIAVLDEQPLLVRYEILCDPDWSTRRVKVERTIGPETRFLMLSASADGVWRTEEQEFSVLTGCVDIDLAITPATNTLALRRLNLAIGQSAEVTAAWIKFPNLNLEPLSQTYTRLAEDRYRYQSATGFSTEITVDEIGLVKTYPGGWERLV